MTKHYTSCVELLDRAAELYKTDIAFTDAEGDISYTELQKSAKALAAGLIANADTGRTRPVMVYLPKSIRSIVTFMGSMYSGSPYVPMDYNVPMARFLATAENLRPCAVVTDAAGRAKLEATGAELTVLVYDELVEGVTGGRFSCHDSVRNRPHSHGDDICRSKSQEEYPLSRGYSSCDLDPAYIMYTSGSSGTPKGVTVSHRAVLDYTKWLSDTFDISRGDVLGMQSAFHFDNSVFDMYLSLYLGCRTVIIPEQLFMYPDMLFDYMGEQKISVIFWVPTVMISAANSGVLDRVRSEYLRLILFAGEVMPIRQLNLWRGAYPDCTFVNMYGPTEATDIVLYYVVDRPYEVGQTLPIGIPCNNMKALILDENNRLCAPGEQGELCIGGSGIASGYWNAPEITAKAFIQNPLNNKYRDLIYRTGDLVYEAEDGNIIFLGRADSQIKLRGNRIELGDIEAAAAAMENIKSCCAMFDREKEEIYLFLETDAEIVPRRFIMELKKYIPAYMAPQKIIALPAFPHTPSGKIDRQGLKKQFMEAD